MDAIHRVNSLGILQSRRGAIVHAMSITFGLHAVLSRRDVLGRTIHVGPSD